MLINYQGYLTDDSGTPLSGKQSVNFRLYSLETGGFFFWQEEQLVVITDGVFNVHLGAVAPLPATVFNLDTIYLEIQIFNADSVWETLRPRQQFTSSAFAVRAGNADMLEGQTLSDLDTDYVNAGEVDAVTAAMIVDDSIGASDLGDDSVGAAEIITGAMTTAKLADNAVTTDKLADNAVGSGQVADNSLTALDLAPNSIGSNEVIDNSLTTVDLASNSVTASKIAAGAVGSSEILDGTVAANDLADDYVNTTGDTMTGDLIIGGDINTNGVIRMDGGPVLKIDISGNLNAFLGYYAGDSNTLGIGNIFLGNWAGNTNLTGNDNTFIGCDADASADNLVNATAIGNSAEVDGSNRVRIGNTYVSQIGGNVAWSNLSDIRNKEDIADLYLGLGFITALRPVAFRLINGNGRVDLGFIAQEIQELLGTEYNILGIGGDTGRTLSLRYTDFIAPMVKAIQEQQKIIESQNGMITELRSAVAELQEKVVAIQAVR